MGELVRIGVSLEEQLLKRFDHWLAERGITNRSEALRDLVRDHLVEAELGEDVESVASVTIVYDHRRRDLASSLTSMQHDHNHHVISSMHVHIDDIHCLEVIVLRGRIGKIRKLSDKMIAAKGVLHGKMIATSVTAIANEHDEKDK